MVGERLESKPISIQVKDLFKDLGDKSIGTQTFKHDGGLAEYVSNQSNFLARPQVIDSPFHLIRTEERKEKWMGVRSCHLD